MFECVYMCLLVQVYQRIAPCLGVERESVFECV